MALASGDEQGQRSLSLLDRRVQFGGQPTARAPGTMVGGLNVAPRDAPSDELELEGFKVSAGQLGENITTRGVDLLGLPTGTLLHLGEQAVLEVTGLRNPCSKINDFRKGLLGEVFTMDPLSGECTFKCGVMAVVRRGGTVRPDDSVRVETPPLPHRPLERV
ncbi:MULTISPECIES: MOSC domain-containing protein [Streptomyces]|uniref:MOSC domain-containing protein n=1 Tax=Streptomyces caniscabiei TaxID=2746961 RepID=A0ABU4N3L8_9ACTN|nr:MULTISPECIES: MOSC domain-containing protein [Streptomyces]MDX2948459.1 MOSC domain-containing protein [Streptomyces caniscabiei]MDX2983035.1 MOSC domain-containing protein [Streptomyces caniscabiei]MDX3015747.1 MOSC domain-containing protein [Streptomyces caniscabiei]MDX3043437.1 MOSC domain-containing protein [Streptomyces caniscabiei]